MIDRVLIVDDHALVAAVLRFALRQRGWSAETAAGLTADKVLQHARRFRPGCVLLDPPPGPTTIGIQLIAPLRAIGAEMVILSADTEPAVLAAYLEAGAAGWISKHDALDEVEAVLTKLQEGVPLIGRGRREAILDELRRQRASRRQALSPFERLTTCERDMLAALVEGLSAEEIAATRYISVSTVRSHIRGVLRKLGVRSQLAAVAHATRAGWSDHRDDVAVA